MTTRSGRTLTVLKPKGRKLTMTFQKPSVHRQEELMEPDYSSAIVMATKKPNDQELDVDAPIELPIPDIILEARKELETIYILDSDDEDDAGDDEDVIVISDSESEDDSKQEHEEMEDDCDEIEAGEIKADNDEIEADDNEIEDDGDNDEIEDDGEEIKTKKRRRERPDFKLHDDFMAAQSVWDRQRNDRQRHAWQMAQVKALSEESLGHITGRK